MIWLPEVLYMPPRFPKAPRCYPRDSRQCSMSGSWTRAMNSASIARTTFTCILDSACIRALAKYLDRAQIPDILKPLLQQTGLRRVSEESGGNFNTAFPFHPV